VIGSRGRQRAESSAKNRAIVASALIFLVGLGVVLTVSIARSRQGFNRLFLSGVVLLGAILTIVVLFVLGRNLVKLYLERSRGVPGSRYRTKVISLVAGLTLLPSLLLFFIASGLLQAAVEQWFDPHLETVLEDGMALVNHYEAEEAARCLRYARNIAGEVTARGLLAAKGRRAADSLLEAKRDEYGLAGLRLYESQGRVVAEAYDPAREGVLRGLKLSERSLAELVQGKQDSLRFSDEEKTGELLLLLGVPVASDGKMKGAVVAVQRLGIDPSQRLRDISRHYETYKQAKEKQGDVRAGFVLVLALFTLVLLFSAIWVGSALAKGMTVPIQRLAEATQAVSAGRFDVRVEVDAPDEVGELVRSFNRMIEELRIGKLKVERSTVELRESNIELEGRRKYIETILESSPTGVVSLDQTGRITNLNRAALRMFGFKERPPSWIHYRELFATKDFLELRILIEKVLGIRDIGLQREIHLRIDRRTVDLAVSFTALRDAEEQYIGLILVLEDISNLIKAQKVAAWREVARRIAHEIKNPLTPIQLSAQRILKKWREGDPDVGAVIEECTETITQYVDGLKTLVNEFSRFARMPPIAPVPTELDKVVHSALVLYEGLSPGVTISRHVAAGIPTMNLDPEQMKRVLINLVDNAIQCQNGAGHVAVLVSYDPRTQSARIEVADEGPGIPAEDRDKLFVPYFSTRPGGTGLGLAIVHRIVSDHNGNIRIEENVPRGTRFVIELPA
jgi:two-component system nitrogen regulation sensor histidine kinase NtrY